MQSTASIIITSFNYAQYLREAIDSALAQRYGNFEVIVVDDGSTDGSREIIAGYGERVVAVFKENGGQGSAFNSGFHASGGEIVVFLDADDVLFPDVLAETATEFQQPEVVKVQWPMWATHADGRRTGKQWPSRLSDGDLRDVVLANGPASITSAPTSGNAWRREFLHRVLPVPEHISYYRVCADEYLYNLAPLAGRIQTLREPKGLYRLHGRNIYSGLTFSQQLELELKGHEEQCEALGAAMRRLGGEPDLARWRETFWFRRLQRAIDAMTSRIPAGSRLILVDDAAWGAGDALARYDVLPFLERDGAYVGAPGDDATALEELGRMRRQGCRFIAFAWCAFWWLAHYPALKRELYERARPVIETDDVLVFDLGQAT